MAVLKDQDRRYADLVLRSGILWTADAQLPEAEAVAVQDGIIRHVGLDAEIEDFIGPSTEVIDLKGALVLPGFIDSHTHFLEGGFSLDRIDLRGVRSREEFIKRTADRAGKMKTGQWLLGGIWDHQQFDVPELPHKEWIDGVTSHHPVCFHRLDMHMALVNSLALRLAGITRDTPGPTGGEIVKDPDTGEPTGILRDAALDIVEAVIPAPSFGQECRAAAKAVKHANSMGVTTVHEMAFPTRFAVYKHLLDQGDLTVRLRVYIQMPDIDDFAKIKSLLPEETPLIAFGGMKGFVDGSLGSSTALFFEPYTDNPGTKGLLSEHMFPEGIMEQRIRKADRLGLQVAVHAIGDRANHILLDLFEAVMKDSPKRDRRWRIEHAQHLLPEDIGRLSRLGVIASVQPYHAYDDGQWAEKKIGPDRIKATYPFRSLLDKKTFLAFGSDWTVAPLDPILAIYEAVTRQTRNGKNPGGWIPEQKISVEEAVKACTWNGAYAGFSEDTKGSITKNKLADMVVLSRNIFTIPPEEIKTAHAAMTLFSGKIVYRRT